jgi:hypothetical protein
LSYHKRKTCSRRHVILSLSVAFAVCLLAFSIWLVSYGSDNLKPNGSSRLKLPLNQADAIKRAIEIAPEYGIDLPKPSKILAEQMTLGEWDKLAGNMPGPQGAKFGLDPNQLVWVVTLIGDGFWAESVPSSQGGDKIDNITLVISAATEKHIETRVLAPADSLPFGN